MGRIEASFNFRNFATFFQGFFFFIQLFWWAASECYSPNDTPAVGNAACKPSADESVCCAVGWACLENGLCVSTSLSDNISPNQYAEGTCTVKRFDSNLCLRHCGGE